ncbi:MAG: chloride channel protein, partial [Lachnospiraceae bacterium]|nr:chloride channel protein [Lachnospiraceae bacterium]
VAIQRGSDEIIPRGRTKLQTGDVIVAMTDEADVSAVHDEMERLCREAYGR